MTLPPGFVAAPSRDSYDVVIVGGAIYGSAVAWFLRQEGVDGPIAVIERDPSYASASTTATNSCIRQQFTAPVNVAISRFGAEYIASLRERFGGDARIPDTAIRSFGYLYLAGDERQAAALRAAQGVQAAAGAATRHMTPDAIAAAYPFYDLTGIVAGNHNARDEGWFDGQLLFDCWRRGAREAGVEFVAAEVAGLDMRANRVEAVRLSDGTRLACGAVVNAAGPRAARIAAMASIDLPVEPRKRYSFVFEAEALGQDLPLTIDPSGIHVRWDQSGYLAGCAPDEDRAVEADDLAMDHGIFERKVWPVLAARIPAFERLRLTAEWAGHYAYNVLDRNALLGPHPAVENLHFCNGFSGHGLQQSPAVARGVAERVAHGRYRTLDLSALDAARLAEGRALVERAVI